MDKETLEEAAENYFKEKELSGYTYEVKDGFLAGANWQADRMYSEEDMIEFSEWVNLNSPNQHNYVRAIQKRYHGIYVPEEKLKGYYSTKELFEKFKNEKDINS